MMDLPVGWPGYVVGALGALLALIPALKKGKTEHTAVLLEGWQRMYDAHEKRIAAYEVRIEGYEGRIETYERRIEAYEKRISGLVQENGNIIERLRKTEERVQGLEETIRSKDQEIAALRSEIRQISQSTASQLRRRAPLAGEPAGSESDDIAKLDRAGHNSMPKGDK